MNVFITGSSGQIGSYLVEALSNKHSVFGIDIRESKYTSHVADIRERRVIEKLLREMNVDAVIHCAAQVSVARSLEDPFYDESVNIRGNAESAGSGEERGC